RRLPEEGEDRPRRREDGARAALEIREAPQDAERRVAVLRPLLLRSGDVQMTTINVNGKAHEVAAAPDTPLLYVLRNELELSGPKFGCGLGQCGACTVHIDGKPARSCSVPVSAVKGKVTTVEGLGTPEKPHPLQAAFIAEQAAQCGYCINGM